MAEIKISIFRDDLYDNPAYVGAHLCLPAVSSEIQDALEKARIDDQHPDFTVANYECKQDYLNELLPKKASIYELEYLQDGYLVCMILKKHLYLGIHMIIVAPANATNPPSQSKRSGLFLSIIQPQKRDKTMNIPP